MPTGIFKRKITKQEPGFKRMWDSNHYKSKGLPFECFKLIVTQPCAYCGEPPRLSNPFGKTFEVYCRTFKRKSGSYEYWNAQWINVHGIDKVVPTSDYSDLTNLVSCCITCNWLKGLLNKDFFLNHINKIYIHQNQIKTDNAKE